MELAIGLGGDQPERRIHAAEHHFNAGDPERARALLEKTLDKLSSGTLRGTALNLLAGVHLYDDNWTEAVAVLERALDDAKDSPALLVQTLIVLAFGQRMISKFDESLVSARMAVTYAEQLGDRGPHQQSARNGGPVELHVRTRGRRDQSATGGGVGRFRHRRAHPVQRKHDRGFGAGLDRAVGRGPRQNGGAAPPMHRARRRERSHGRRKLRSVDRDLARQPHRGRAAGRRSHGARRAGQRFVGHRPFHAGNGDCLRWART